jgi:PadR family transcriptional regulator, regulatory protein PadR
VGVGVLHPYRRSRRATRTASSCFKARSTCSSCRPCSGGPRHGYAISRAIRTESGERLQVDTGLLHPALHRLERQGWITAEWQRSANKQPTRVYKLTAAGKRQLTSERSRWEQLGDAIGAILGKAREGTA